MFGVWAQETNMKLWYNNPAENWNEALPIGNGRLGAMVFGQPEREQIQLNEETVWSGGPGNNTNPDIKKLLPQITNLLFQNKYMEAGTMANEKVTSKTNGMKYQPVGNLWINFPNQGEISDYYRDLNIEDAVSSVEYKSDGVTYYRKFFSSFTDNVIIVRLTADKPGKISCSLGIDCQLRSSITIDNNQIINLSGITDDHEGVLGRVRFHALVKPVCEGGSFSVFQKQLIIDKADAATIYISVATNFNNYKDISADAFIRADSILKKAIAVDYRTAIKNHSFYYQKYFNRVKLDLGTTAAAKKPTDVRINAFKRGNDPQLVSLYFQYGRYLLISSSSYPGTQPANLQGIWNDKVSPPWDSKYTTNINLEMNYWPVENTNLSEMSQPFLQMIEDLSYSGNETAREIYGARGWVFHHNTDIWRITGPVDHACTGLWPTGGAWLSQQLWEHYLYTGDKAFLKDRAFPVMKKASEFFMDILQKEPEHGWLVVSPSISPEHRYMDNISTCAGATMDNQLLFDLFSNTIRTAYILKTDSSFADSLKDIKKQLPPMQIGKYGQLQEWMKDRDNPEDHHRHVSHLYGLFPSNQISPYRTPALFNAAKQSLIYRGDASTGWSMGWKVNLWARLFEGNHAYGLIEDQLTPAERSDGKVRGGIYYNMLDACPPFQIDGNFGCTAGIAEMLVQSYDGFIFILPSLPDRWSTGSVKGLLARGGFEINVQWREGKPEKLTIFSKLGGNCRIRLRTSLKRADGTQIKKSHGENSNPFYQTNTIKEPLIPEKASVSKLTLSKTYLYDFSTKAGHTYSFVK